MKNSKSTSTLDLHEFGVTTQDPQDLCVIPLSTLERLIANLQNTKFWKIKQEIIDKLRKIEDPQAFFEALMSEAAFRATVNEFDNYMVDKLAAEAAEQEAWHEEQQHLEELQNREEAERLSKEEEKLEAID